MSKKREIIICPTCDGVGEISWDECTNHHKGEYDTHYETCTACAGTGRVVKTTEVTFKPYEPREKN